MVGMLSSLFMEVLSNTKLLLVKQTSGYILLVGFLPFTMLILTFAMSEHLVAQKVWQY